jgi:general secretion pathway protein G
MRSRLFAVSLFAVLGFLALGSGTRGTTAMVRIKYLEAALETFRMDNGRYPTTEEGLAALVVRPPGLEASATYQAGGYLREARVPEDPWGNPFEYRSPPQRNVAGFDLWSFGADDAPGGTDFDADIGNWPGGFDEHGAMQRREGLLFGVLLGAAAGTLLGLPVYLFGLVSAAMGRRTWRSALVGAPFAVVIYLSTICALLSALAMTGIIE